MDKMNIGGNVCIIPARGGSKRIPRKNIKAFCGKPIIAYSVEAAVNSGLFSEVMVSTDDNEIADIAKKSGAKVPFLRSEKNSDDYAVMADVLIEVLCEYKKLGITFDNMCCIYPTAPFVTVEKLTYAYEKFLSSGADMLEAVVTYSYPPQRSLNLSDDGLLYRYPEHICARSQDLEPWYHDAGQFYFYKISAFEKSILTNGIKGGYMLKCAPYILTELEVQDIDSLSDWKLAELKYKLMTNEVVD